MKLKTTSWLVVVVMLGSLSWTGQIAAQQAGTSSATQLPQPSMPPPGSATIPQPGSQQTDSASRRMSTTSPSPTSIDYSASKPLLDVWGAYRSPLVPEPSMSNSVRIQSLIHDGKLVLSLQDAIALALENNLDIAIARYQIPLAQSDYLRAKGGGAARGVSGASISSALFSGAIGGGGGSGGSGGGGGAGGFTGGGGAIQTGSTSCCDPVAGVSYGWNHRSSPLNNLVVSGVPAVISSNTNISPFITQGFFTGTSYTVALSGFRQSVNSQFNLFNPEVSTQLTLGFSQRLLNGFGYRANAASLRIAKNDLKVADSTFRQQVLTTVAQVVNLYSDLLSFRENVRVTEEALTYANKLLSDNKRQVEIGTLAPIEVVRAESEVAARQQDLIVAQTSYQQQQETLKTAISKHVDADLASVQVEPTDSLPEPRANDVPPLDQALRDALQNRPELEQAELNLRNQEITIQAVRNRLLPSANIFGTLAPTGLSGNRLLQSCPAGTSLAGANCQPGSRPPSVVGVIPGGVTQSLSQVFHNNFPDYSLGASLQIPIRNRTAQADAATALLQERQLQTQLQRTKNIVEQDIRNAIIGVTQAKAQIEAAKKATEFARQTLEAERKKFQLGESTVFLVIQTQRDLAIAEGNEVKARSAYSKALTAYGTSSATTLATYRIELSDARLGQSVRVPNIPGTPEGQGNTH